VGGHSYLSKRPLLDVLSLPSLHGKIQMTRREMISKFHKLAIVLSLFLLLTIFLLLSLLIVILRMVSFGFDYYWACQGSGFDHKVLSLLTTCENVAYLAFSLPQVESTWIDFATMRMF